MNALLSLWLPILLSAVVVFIISSLVHMVIKWHAREYAGFANEDAVRDVLRASGAIQGKRYVVPYCKDMKEMGSEVMQKKYREGPTAIIGFGPNGSPNMGKHLGLWFVWSVVVAVVAAYLAARFVPGGREHALAAATLAGAVTFVAHGFGSVQESIWMYRSWSSSVTYMLDGLLYGLGTGAVFYFLWR